jgi:hypothetical protein
MIKLTQVETGKDVWINKSHISVVWRHGAGSLVFFGKDNHVEVIQTPNEIQELYKV